MRFARTADEVAAIADAAIAAADELLAGVEGSTDAPSWAATCAPLDEATDVLARAFGRAGFLGFVHDDPDLREAGRRATERLEQWASDLWFRDDLHAAMTAFAETEEAAGLNGERARFLAFAMRDLRRAGHELSTEERAELRRLTERMVEIATAFERNLADVDDVLLVDTHGLDGLPEPYVQGLEREDDGRYRITMAYPDVLPFLDLARDRDLRRQLDGLFNSRAAASNRPLLEEVVGLRARAAELLGQPTWAHHRLEVRMAGTPDAVESMYADLVPRLQAAAREQLEVLRRLLVQDTGDADAVVQRWDWRHYHARLEREQHGVDQQEVAAHLALEPVLDGMLELTGAVLGLTYHELDTETWHADVRTYEVRDADSDDLLATFHMDLHPRPGTFGHAAAFPLVPGRRLPDGSYQRPVSAIVANFTKPSTERPSLLQHDELSTLFHEFGHILHQVLTQAELARFAGTAVETDFVEAPSQIMEHWTWQPEVLARFARHHETGAALPKELVDGLVDARGLDAAVKALRQAQFGRFDLAVHGVTPSEAEELDLDEVVRDAAEVTLLPTVEGVFWPASFGHLLGQYDAGYYGYQWAEAIGDDLFSRFADEGVTSPQVGADYRREVLERGGTRDADEHVEAFLGRQSTNDAYLAKLGIS